MAIRFISDLHFNHKNVIKFDQRPFSTIKEHNQFIIEKWNSVVDNRDTVYIIGDVGFGGSEAIRKLVLQLKGHLYLVIGNHDRKLLKNPDFRVLFDSIDEKVVMSLDNKRITLNHEPITHHDCQFYGGEMYYGHVHNGKSWEAVLKEQELLRQMGIPTNMYNVGICCPYMDWAPRTSEEIKEGFQKWYEEEYKKCLK